MSTDNVEARRQSLLIQRQQIDRELAALEGAPESSPLPEPSRARSDGRKTGGRPVRGIVLDVLDDLAVPTYTRELMHYVRAGYGIGIPADRFGSLRHKEREAYDAARGRTVFIGSALTVRGESIKRLLIRSDWNLADRVVAPTTGRRQFLRITKRLIEIALTRHDAIADWDAFRILVGDHVRDIPGIVFRRDDWKPEAWHEVVESVLLEIEERDAQARAQVALRLQNTMSERDLIFGTEDRVDPEPRIVAPIRAEHFA
jgi:hypothetical protein